MKNPHHFRNLLKEADARHRLGASQNTAAHACGGFKSYAELHQAALDEAKAAEPKKVVETEKRYKELAQIAAEAQGEAIALRDELENAKIEADRNQRNLFEATSALNRFEEYANSIDPAIAEKIAALNEPHFIISTFTDNHGQILRIEKGMLDAILELRLRKELVPAQRAAFTAKVDELKKLVK